MCIEREAEEKALRSYLNEQDAEQWDRDRIEAGEPHPCAACEGKCVPSCRFFAVRHTYKPVFTANLHPFIAGIFKQHFGI